MPIEDGWDNANCDDGSVGATTSQPQGFGPPVITVDIEDWPQSTWDRNLAITERAATNTRRLFDIMNDLGVCCTMFVLGKFAESFPSVVRHIHAEGHEVASHGYGHTEVFHQSRQQFAKEVRRSKESLEQLIGAPVYGYRAPDFSIVRKTLWALDILAEVGFAYDSSIFPIKHPRYGIPDWPVAPRCLQLDNGRSIVEFPIATLPGHNRNWPIGGGGYFRLLPGVIARHAAKRVLSSMPFVLYCHPYEFDPREFREIPLRVPLKLRLHQGIGRRWFEGRFRAFVERFGGQRMIDLFWSTKWPTIRPESRLV